MESPFAFLGNAKPAAIFKLLANLPAADAAVAVAGLPASLGAQVLGYFSEAGQADMLPKLRQARRADSLRAAEVAERIRRLLLEMKARNAGSAGRPAGPAPTPPPASAPPPLRAKPKPWLPRSATASPINGPAIAGQPPPVAGRPLESPLLQAGGLAELLAGARERLLPRDSLSRTRERPEPGRAEPAEGFSPAGRIQVGGPPRLIGSAAPRRPAREPEERGRALDGKAILASILRASDAEVREAVRRSEPALYREMRNRMFYFDDLLLTGDDALARVFTAAPAAAAALALRFGPPLLRERVMRAVSPGRGQALREAAAGPAGLDAAEAAQKKVLDVALQLQAAGRILIDPEDPDLA